MRARAAAFAVLDDSAAALAAEWNITDAAGLTLAGWSLAHGLATLLLAGNLADRLPLDQQSITETLAHGLINLGAVAAKEQAANESARGG
jgi:hypothetical protein